MLLILLYWFYGIQFTAGFCLLSPWLLLRASRPCLLGLRSRSRSRSRSRPESVVLTGVGVGVGKFSSTPTPARSRSRLQHFFVISFLVKMETEHYLRADCRRPRWFVVYSALSAGVAFVFFCFFFISKRCFFHSKTFIFIHKITNHHDTMSHTLIYIFLSDPSGQAGVAPVPTHIGKLLGQRPVSPTARATRQHIGLVSPTPGPRSPRGCVCFRVN